MGVYLTCLQCVYYAPRALGRGVYLCSIAHYSMFYLTFSSFFRMISHQCAVTQTGSKSFQGLIYMGYTFPSSTKQHNSVSIELRLSECPKFTKFPKFKLKSQPLHGSGGFIFEANLNSFWKHLVNGYGKGLKINLGQVAKNAIPPLITHSGRSSGPHTVGNLGGSGGGQLLVVFYTII